MPETIAFKGLTTDTPEGFNPDGELAVSHNIILEDGAMRPIMPPKPFGISHMNKDRDLVFIHKSASFEHDHYIIFQKTDSTLHFYNEVFTHGTLPKPPATTMPIDPEIKPMAAAVAASEEETDDTYPPLIAITTEPVEGLKDIAAIGNTLVITTSAGVAYAVWKGDKYNYLGTSMPQVNIEFSLGMATSLSPNDDMSAEIPYDDPSTDPRNWFRDAHPIDAVFWHKKGLREKAIEEVMAKLLPNINEYITSQGRFYQPFFIRYAFKLYDGSYAYHSAPVLILPTVMIPKLSVGKFKSEDNQLKFDLNWSEIYHHALFYRTLAVDLQRLELWKDIIVGIDFFISAPIYTYSQSAPPSRQYTTVYRELEYAANVVETDNTDLPDSRGDSDSLSGSTDSTWRPPYGSTGNVDIPLYDGTYDGHDIYFRKEDDYRIFPFERNPAFIDQITSCAQFYYYATIPIEDIKQQEYFELMPVNEAERDLTNLLSRRTLTDDYQSRHSIIAENIITYNNRVQLAGVSLRVPESFPIRTVTPFLSQLKNHHVDSPGTVVLPGDIYLPQYPVEIAVVCSKDGKEVSSLISPDLFDNSKPDLSPVCIAWDEQFFPRYIYYPDSSAKEIIVKVCVDSNPLYYRLPMKAHPTLNGSYYFRGFSPYLLKTSEPIELTVNNSLPQANKIYTSEVNNPFVFPPEGINSVGTGAVIAIATASRPLSQGQFGQFPLYAFTTEGIWALSVNEVGLYNTVQPISREVCLGANSIAPLDSTVAFISKRGVMLISGAEVDCISKNLDRAPALHSWSNPPFGMPGQLDFQEFIKAARIAYDYARQRLILINGEHSMSFVCSLKSGAWATMDSSLTEPLNTYPDTLIKGYVDGTQMLFDFDVSASDTTEAVIVTRPISFRAPHTLKTLRDIVLDADILPLGASRKEPWKAVIGVAGSRNLEHWHTFARRNGKGVRGVSGTPYQFHCLCISVPLTQYDSIIGATVEVVPKYTRKLR